MQSMALNHATFTPDPPPPPCTLQVLKLHISNVFCDLACANVGPIWLKIALNHLFEHPKWSRNDFGKKFLTTFGPIGDPVTLP